MNVPGRCVTPPSPAGDLDATSALKLQMAMDRMNKLLETLANVLKKMSETQNSIIQNLK